MFERCQSGLGTQVLCGVLIPSAPEEKKGNGSFACIAEGAWKVPKMAQGPGWPRISPCSSSATQSKRRVVVRGEQQVSG